MRRTKIVATIGPASDSPERLDLLIGAGLDVARLNVSHSSPAELATRLEAIRDAAGRAHRHIAVLLDLAGPKLRIGDVAEGTVLTPDSTFVLTAEEVLGDAGRVHVSYEGLSDDVGRGDRILLDDGRIELTVLGVSDGEVRTSVRAGGPLSSNKGLNVPGVRLGVEGVTRFDRAMAEWAVAKGVDYVAQSFVRSPGDIAALRELLHGESIPVIAKIEKHEAINHMGAIIGAADAVMVARGDLGVETSPEEVPVLQRRIIAACRAAGTPVIVATQMLESMTTSTKPTRAEASDVANAIYDEVDAVMLSAETAIGEHPVEAVATMARIAVAAEGSVGDQGHDRKPPDRSNVTQAVSAAACDLAVDLELDAILTATQTGSTARAVARHRPPVPVVAVTPHESVARRLSLVWGVSSVVAPVAPTGDYALGSLAAAVRDAGEIAAGQRVAVTAGIARGVPGTTDFILVREVPHGDSSA